MAQMNISNLLWNDTKEAKIALAQQIFDNINWNDYYYIGDDGSTVYPFSSKDNLDKFQSRLNEIFLTHYTDFQKFLNTKGIEGVIDTWKDVEEFLQNITDDETMTLMKLMGDLQAASGQLNIRMSTETPGLVEAVTRTDSPLISKSYINTETGAINVVYTFE
jgi:hypothetical protein